MPLFVRDILSACRLVVAASVPGSRPSPDTELTLGLKALDGMYFLVRALAVTGRSAVIEVRRGAKRAELRFIDGVLASAQLGPVQGLPALHQMLLWDDAELRFKFRNVVRSGTQLSMKSSEVIEECDRFLRDFAHEVRDMGMAHTVYSTNGVQVQPSSALPSEVLPVLRLFDGGQTLGQVLEESPFRVFDTLKIIRRFVDDEAISLQAPLPAPHQEVPTAMSGPAALDRWLQQQAPALGPEVGTPVGGTPSHGVAGSAGAGAGSAGAGAGPDGSAGSPVGTESGAGARASSPFVAVQDVQPTPDTADIGHRKRTITLKELVIQVPDAGAPRQAGTAPPAAYAPDGVPKPTTTVARGEIEVASLTIDAAETAPGPDAPSVLIEIGPLPTPVALAAFAPAPLSALTPPPPVIVAPTGPTPTEAVAPRIHASSGVGTNNTGRSPSNGFNDVEADFFDREADLYKKESVESFDDLDRKAGSRRPIGGSNRKP